MHPVTIAIGAAGTYLAWDKLAKPYLAKRALLKKIAGPTKAGWMPAYYPGGWCPAGWAQPQPQWGVPQSPSGPYGTLPWYSPWGPAFGQASAVPVYGPGSSSQYGLQSGPGGLVAQWSNVPGAAGTPTGPGSPIQGAPIGQGGLVAEWSNV